MTIDDNTGQNAVCPICDNPDYGDCGHLVAIYDLTFLECNGGEIYHREGHITCVIEKVFVSHLQNGSEPSLQNATLAELWESTKSSVEPDEDDANLDRHTLQTFLIELLEDSGAEQAPGALMDPGGPGMTSSITLLFAEQPSEVIDMAIKRVARDLGQTYLNGPDN